ncbi:hypothetical protein CAL29_22965 [Bordetella genomosp. 10]|uniref:Uncharacterized protein n=1 Tax=Bordetella genomosp. 10 TaxID=1416804 RepID=A0A261S0G8_9BORD|nr:hypothetical protein CAL29_22965 [Bordetella genomosp. 10]
MLHQARPLHRRMRKAQCAGADGASCPGVEVKQMGFARDEMPGIKAPEKPDPAKMCALRAARTVPYAIPYTNWAHLSLFRIARYPVLNIPKKGIAFLGAICEFFFDIDRYHERQVESTIS